MRRLGVLTAVLLSACTSGSISTGSSPAPATPLPSAAATISPSPPTVATLPCKMPASLRVDQGGMREVLGWLSLPSGVTTDDPVNHIIVSGNFPTGGGGSVPIWATDQSPQLYGYPLGTYSTAISRWLPAPPELVSPDGMHYAYLHADGTIRLADSNQGEAIVQNPNKLTPLAYASFGVVLTSSEIASNGLWLLDPSTHLITTITPAAGNDNWLGVSGIAGWSTPPGTLGMAWGVDSPGALGYPAPTKVFYKFIGANVPPILAFTAPAGDSIALIAFDGLGLLLVALTGSAPGLDYQDHGGVVSQVSVPAGVSPATLGPRQHADAHGIWFIGQSGMFLFSPATGLKKIAPGTPNDIVPAGDCV